ncbi:glycosyltransferase family 2 protein [Lichenifustis flavocetrariae]|uniref:Glycosyltransferase family 2 protein n=1 Tax=Lichenifustis flavocetrariae TaxID=2949735 RepID=A0AA41Z233_9HYPH|nr:glycosyltransferase family 2 protein [Lichenifustis flavocetrariae]MCW6511415.1 glycosyltransferase family 2 protein [Lichenifustis flavocetrariae]
MIAFNPLPNGKQNPRQTVDRNGKYAFESARGRYVYIPPRRPDRGPDAFSPATHKIKFSIVVPVYNTEPDLLDRMVASVLVQWHADWELIIVDDASPDERTRVALAQLSDPRIRVERQARNGGISAATNAALDLATGDFVVFLDHDDELTADCLHELALCIARQDPDFIYSDEDKIDTDGGYIQPFFKPDWSPDTMMSTMFTCHVMCVRRAILDVVGGLRSEFDGSQDYDFVLRLVEKTDRIAHIPKILYHWRIIPASVAADMNAKPYAIDASRRAREAALHRRGLPGTVEPVAQMPVYFRVNYALRHTPTISIIIPTKNNAVVLERCIQSIYERTRYAQFEIIVMDNGSTEADAFAVLRKLERQPKTRVHVHRKPFNYSEINNAGVRHAAGDLLLFLNDDTEVMSEDWLDRMGGYAQLAHIGAVGAKLLYPGTRRIQHNGVLNLDDGPTHAFHNMAADDPGYFMRNLLEWNWAAVTGACMMIERRKFDAVGGFDEGFPIAYNDVKLCFDLRDRGFYNVVCPSVELIHYESHSRGLDAHSLEKTRRLERERARLYQECPQHFMRDPFHSPNLSATSTHFDLPAA